MNRNELYHYGILGMKWGVRRYQNYDGTRTAAGLKKEAKERGTLRTYLANRRNDKSKYKASLKKLQSSKEFRRASSEKQQEMLGKERLKYENARKKNGLTPEQKKKLAIAVGVVGAVAVTAAVAYAVKNKYAAEVAGTILKSGTKFQVIEDTQVDDFDHTFYAAAGARDKTIYKGLYGMQKAMTGGDVYAHTVNVNKDIKVAPRQAAIEEFRKLYESNSDFRKGVDENLNAFNDQFAPLKASLPKQATLFENAVRDARNTRSSARDYSNMYDAFNVGLANHGSKLQTSKAVDESHKVFYNTLKNKGYGAIVDRNDNKYSGFKANSPYIVFDHENVGRESVRQLGFGEIALNNMGQDIIRNGKTYAAYGAVGVGINIYSNATNRNAYISSQVNAYKKNHPNTKMTDSEIEKMVIEDTKWDK